MCGFNDGEFWADFLNLVKGKWICSSCPCKKE